ncbi:MAG: hypothetical protein GY928_08730, partial [Colwellia sp.]|nr:hypothetical protein [Colwellia sp.]
MGGAIKQLAVVASVIALATLSGGTSLLVGGMFGSTVGGALLAVELSLIASVVGKALGLGKTNIDDSQPISNYALTSLQNQANNNSVRPIVYGECRLGATRVFSDIQTGGKSHLYEILVFAGHECEEVVKLLADNSEMTQGTGADTDKWRSDSDNLLVQVYTNKPATVQAITSYDGSWNISNLKDLTFTNGAFLDENLPDNITFAVVHHHYSSSNYTARKPITARIKGKKIRTILSDTELSTTLSYSNNPAEIMLDFLTEQKTFNEADNKIDISSFYTSKLLNDKNAFSCNIAFTSKTNVSAAFQEIKATNRSDAIYSQGVWKIKQDEKQKEVSFNITSSDIISGSFNWSQKKARDIANKIIVTYIEPTDQWQTKKTIPIENTDLIASDGRTYTKEINLRGVTNLAQAD